MRCSEEKLRRSSGGGIDFLLEDFIRASYHVNDDESLRDVRRDINQGAAMLKVLPVAFAFLIGAVALWTGIRQIRNRANLSRWPTAKGTVIERGTFRPVIATATQSAFRYAPLIKYTYQVNGQEFTNDCVHAKRIQQPQHGTQKWAQASADLFPDEVIVHFNPEDPGESFLKETSRLMLGGLLVASLFAFLVGVVLLVTK